MPEKKPDGDAVKVYVRHQHDGEAPEALVEIIAAPRGGPSAVLAQARGGQRPDALARAALAQLASRLADAHEKLHAMGLVPAPPRIEPRTVGQAIRTYDPSKVEVSIGGQKLSGYGRANWFGIDVPDPRAGGQPPREAQIVHTDLTGRETWRAHVDGSGFELRIDQLVAYAPRLALTAAYTIATTDDRKRIESVELQRGEAVALSRAVLDGATRAVVAGDAIARLKVELAEAREACRRMREERDAALSTPHAREKVKLAEDLNRVSAERDRLASDLASARSCLQATNLGDAGDWVAEARRLLGANPSESMVDAARRFQKAHSDVVDRLHKERDGLQTRIGSVYQTVSAYRNAGETEDVTLRRLVAERVNLKATLEARERDLRDYRNMHGVGGHYHNIDQRYRQAERKIEELTERSNRFETEAAQLRSRPDARAAVQAIAEKDAKIAELRATNGSLADVIKNQAKTIQDLQGKAPEVDAAIELGRRCQNQEATIRAQEAELVKMRREMAQLIEAGTTAAQVGIRQAGQLEELGAVAQQAHDLSVSRGRELEEKGRSIAELTRHACEQTDKLVLANQQCRELAEEVSRARQGALETDALKRRVALLETQALGHQAALDAATEAREAAERDAQVARGQAGLGELVSERSTTNPDGSRTVTTEYRLAGKTASKTSIVEQRLPPEAPGRVLTPAAAQAIRDALPDHPSNAHDPAHRVGVASPVGGLPTRARVDFSAISRLFGPPKRVEAPEGSPDAGKDGE